MTNLMRNEIILYIFVQFNLKKVIRSEISHAIFS